MPTRREGAQNAMRAAVAVVSGKYEIPRANQLQHESDGRHSGAGHYSASAAFQFRQRVREILARRVASASIVVAALLPEAVEGKRRREMDRRDNRAVMQICRDSGTHSASGCSPGNAWGLMSDIVAHDSASAST